jgi:micrococcal nuclease
LLVAAILMVVRFYQKFEEPTDVPVESALVHVKRVVDGDTLLIDTGERIRLLGVDTPEIKSPDIPPEPFGPEASDFTTKLVSGKTVRLAFDRERFDQYHRTLAYVYLDILLVYEELVRLGFSRAQTQYPFRSDMKRRLLKAESDARERGIGIWSLPNPTRQ